LNHETITKTDVHVSGVSRTITEYKEVDVLLESGVQSQVPEWALENEFFRQLEAEGSASAVA
jgi:hypothetical protein